MVFYGTLALMSPTVKPLDFPSIPTEAIEVDLFGDGQIRSLRYTIASMKRLRKKLGGRPLLGKNSLIVDLDEEMLPELLHEGLRHDPVKGVKCTCGHHDQDGVLPDLDLFDLDLIPAAAYPYLVQKFSLAFLGSTPPEKKVEMPEAVDPMTTAT
jgi:hypothetical protein